jgi:hypothetical protein
LRRGKPRIPRARVSGRLGAVARRRRLARARVCQQKGETSARYRLLALSPLDDPYHHHVDLAAAATGADQSLAQPGNGGAGATFAGHLCGVGLDPTAACLAPDWQPHLRCRLLVGLQTKVSRMWEISPMP